MSWSDSASVTPLRLRSSPPAVSQDGRPARPQLSLSAKDEPALIRAIVRLGSVPGHPTRQKERPQWSSVSRCPLSTRGRREDLGETFRTTLRTRSLSTRWLDWHELRAQRLCQAGVPTWIAHAEIGDDGLTDYERHTLERLVAEVFEGVVAAFEQFARDRQACPLVPDARGGLLVVGVVGGILAAGALRGLV